MYETSLTSPLNSPEGTRAKAFQYHPVSPASTAYVGRGSRLSYDEWDAGDGDGDGRATAPLRGNADAEDEADEDYPSKSPSSSSTRCGGGGGGFAVKAASLLALGALLLGVATHRYSRTATTTKPPIVVPSAASDDGASSADALVFDGVRGSSKDSSSSSSSSSGSSSSSSSSSDSSSSSGSGSSSSSSSSSSDSSSSSSSSSSSADSQRGSDGIDDDDDLAPYRQPLPPLKDLIDAHSDPKGRKVRDGTDVSWMLDFAVIGNAKSGTTFLKNYLGHQSDEIYMDPSETCQMSNNKTAGIVKFFHKHLDEEGGGDDGTTPTKGAFTPDGRRIKNGIKCPKETGTEWGLPNYRTYFPDADFLITVRHPVLWFQSFYNYRAYAPTNDPMPPVRDLIGSCVDDGSPFVCPNACGHIRTRNVCTDRANFHHQLARLGKTNPASSSERERELLRGGEGMGVVPARSRIFLAELGQFMPSNVEASRHVARDLTDFLRLDRPLPSIETVGGHKRHYSDEERISNFINICDAEHDGVREILLDIGRDASEWIRDYFMKSPDVVVSSPEAFVELIEEWGRDPCLGGEGRLLMEDDELLY